MHADYKHGRLELAVGNIVEQTADAIVNAANTKLTGGGGVDGAIHRAAGPALLAECLELPEYEPGRRCPTGECRVTGAGALAARYVIHAVGPYYNERYAEKAACQLREVHRLALQAAAERDCRSIAFPAISTGAYRFPVTQAAPIALDAVREFFASPSTVKVVRFVLFSPSIYNVFAQTLETTLEQ